MSDIKREIVSADPAHLAEVMSSIDALSTDVDIFYSEIQKKADDPTYKGLQFPDTLFPPEGALRLTEAEMRSLYDEFTTIPEHPSPEPAMNSNSDAQSKFRPEKFNLVPEHGSQEEQAESSSNTENQESSSPSPPATTTTSPPSDSRELPSSGCAEAAPDHPQGLSLGDLRYLAWRDITHALQLADRHENLPGLPGRPGDENSVRQRVEAMNIDDFSRFEYVNLTAAAERMANPPVEPAPRSGAELDAARAEIRRLRNLP
jgi:hypothetical protein